MRIGSIDHSCRRRSFLGDDARRISGRVGRKNTNIKGGDHENQQLPPFWCPSFFSWQTTPGESPVHHGRKSPICCRFFNQWGDRKNCTDFPAGGRTA